MNEKYQIDDIRRKFTNKIIEAVAAHDGCIGTFYKNIGGHHADCRTEEEYDTSPIVVSRNDNNRTYGHFEAATVFDLFLDKNMMVCTLNGEAGEEWDESFENIQVEGLLAIVEWLTKNGFIKQEDPWRCEECGSLDVQQRAWVDINDGENINYDDCDRNDYYCHGCSRHNYLVQESDLMKTIEDWFAGHLQPDDDEVISGLKRDDFASDEEYAAACKAQWDARDVESKIHVWHELTRDKSDES